MRPMRGHRAQLSLSASIDLDVEGASGGRLDEDYDGGWRSSAMPWSAAGPPSLAPRLGIADSARAHLGWARSGVADANRWSEAWRIARRSSDVRSGIAKGMLLSSLLVGIIFFFELAFFPRHLFQRAKDEDATGFGHVFFLYPLLGFCYFLASSWTVDVAQATYALRREGMGHFRGMSIATPTLPAGTSRRLLEESYRVFLVLNYSLIAWLLLLVPYIGRPFAFMFMSFIDGYYCFEQAWIARGWSLERRMRYAESRWAYFTAFGIPSTIVSFFHPSPLLNIMLFMLVFPFCTVLAMLAAPQPRVATTSAAVMTPTSAGGGAGMSGTAELSTLLPPRLPIFWLTIHAHRLLLRCFPPPQERGFVSPAPPPRWANAPPSVHAYPLAGASGAQSFTAEARPRRMNFNAGGKRD